MSFGFEYHTHECDNLKQNRIDGSPEKWSHSISEKISSRKDPREFAHLEPDGVKCCIAAMKKELSSYA